MVRKGLLFLYFVLFLSSCGDPYHSIEPRGGFSVAGVEANFNSINTKIIVPKCLECHNSVRKPHGVDLSSYSAIINLNIFPSLITPGDPENSSFYTSVLRGRMPKDSPALSLDELEAIRDWIAKGANVVDKEPAGGEPIDDEPIDDEPIDDEPN